MFRLLALAAALTFAASSTALAQATATGGTVNFNAQICPQVTNQAAAADQYNGGDLAAAIAQNLDISQSAVNHCLQGDGGGSEISGATASAGGEDGATATGGNVTINVQICPQVINQYANAVQSNSGGGVAAGIAQDLGISQSAVNECIQDDGETSGGPAATQYDTGGSDDLARFRTGVLSETVPNKVLAATGGPSFLLPLSALMLAAGLTGFAVLRRR
ncbi:MAG: hypothetical protein H0U65_09335 [Rubrobacter sp.]|nr:hypothetical protein [Rubrobacter sp.]